MDCPIGFGIYSLYSFPLTLYILPRRLRTSKVLLVGMRGLGAEVAKNLILAGVKGLTMMDHQEVRAAVTICHVLQRCPESR